MLETYKSRVDKFALCEGRPSTDNLYVLQVRQACLTPIYLKHSRTGISLKSEHFCVFVVPVIKQAGLCAGAVFPVVDNYVYLSCPC